MTASAPKDWRQGASFTDHVRRRFAERFPGKSLQQEWTAAWLISKRERAILGRWRRAHGRTVCQPGERLFLRPGGALFVVIDAAVVVTALSWAVVEAG